MTIQPENLQKILASKEEFLDLSGQALDDEDIIQIVSILKEKPFIKKINLSYNNIGDKGAKAIAQVETLEEIDFHNGLAGYDDYENHIGPEGAKSFVNSKLKKLDLSGNPIKDEGVIYLAKSPTIIELLVDDCEISYIGTEEFFKTNTVVKKISLMDNKNIGDDGLNTINSNHTIEELNLSRCSISYIGAQHIARNTSLLFLEISENKLRDSGATALAKHPKLTNLTACGCEITDIGAAALAANKTLLSLNLYGNALSRDALSSLAGYYSAYNNFTFTRTSEFIEQLLKKSIDVASHVVGSVVTLPPSPPVISNPLASNPVIFTPIHKRALPSSTQGQERVEDSPPGKVAALVTSTPQYQDFVLTATPEEMQELHRALQEAYELAHRQQTSLSGPPLPL